MLRFSIGFSLFTVPVGVGSIMLLVVLSCLSRESAVNLVRSGSYTRQLWRDEAKGNEAPQTIAPSTYTATYSKRYQLQRGGR